MPVFHLLQNNLAFPPPHLAEPDGLLAVGGDLSAVRLLEAYRQGIFPWFSKGEPLLWWSPDPRFVLFPSELKVAKSMRPLFNQKKFSVTFDQAFGAVMQAAATSRSSTWITPEMVAAYSELHRLGYAHSVEVWQGETLAGGLYGVALGRCFFGESMFAKVPNASKFGFIVLVQWLSSRGFRLIDCQQETAHLGTLGARAVPRAQFLEWLKMNLIQEMGQGKWTL